MVLRKQSITPKRKEVMTWQESRQPRLDAGLIARKGQAKPADIPAGTQQHRRGNGFVLISDRYKRLITYGARFAPRRKNQEIFVEALDAYLETVE